MNSIVHAFSEDRDVQAVVAGIESGMKEQMVAGLAGSARQVMIASMHHDLQRPLLIVTHNMYSAQKIVEDLQECMSDTDVMLYPANEIAVTEIAISSPEIQAQRTQVLGRLTAGFRGVLVVPYAGIRRFIPHRDVYHAARIDVICGASLPLSDFIVQLSALGFERVDRVEQQGQMSVRGGIVDFYPVERPFPYRIEWFDDEVDSIRSFDVVDQRSIEQVKEMTVYPCRELIANDKRFLNAAQHASELLETQRNKVADRQLKDKLSLHIGEEVEKLREQIYFPGIYKYISLLYPERQTLLDFIERDTILIIDEAIRLQETSKQIERDEAEAFTSLLQEGKALPSMVLGKNYESTLQTPKFPAIYFSLFLRQIPHTNPQNIVNFTCRTMQNFHGQMHVLKSEMERWQKNGYRVLILAGGQERMERVRRVLEDYKVPDIEIVQGNLQSGFEFPSIRLSVITEGEIFTQKQRKVRRSERKVENAERIKSYLELKVGDFVVHVNHGIGKFVGIGTLEIGGIHKDYIHIVYAGGDKLSVPIEQIDLIQKYVGAEEKEPKLYKLGGAEWQRAKGKARSSVKDIAEDLIKLYAMRKATKGHAFEPDTSYQKEFEELFAYEETPDQLRTIEEIKRDMEQPQPMDRLLCGDVGYGKTEVAIRAAFKAAIEGKQVAVLVPTTILAQQHFETFRERFSGYPLRVEVLSRFRSRKEQNETIKGIKTGTVDVVIGTHRLLSSDLQFKSLGLLIVDEEQRFGVSHKEKLKQLKLNVDVLTLTATPIPRTLHMSMLGVRDLSVIETPPENRFPVQTYVVEHSFTLVREAIERELARDGQVYYLFNRVQGIYQIAEQISMLVPDARVAVSHGQMSERELEKTILDFLDQEYDVLVSTTIIETGVDIPNVNTLIVHDADKMGLSQLYQLRGRVGRSNRIAYAYFTYQRDKVLQEVAEKRLQAIKEFTELGSGFKIAMRDLSIRGAGNLLGAEQSGFIASVGFDMYAQMLTEEIAKGKAELSGEPVPPVEEIQPHIDLNVDAYLPAEYIYDDVQKIEIYKKVASVRALEEVDDLHDELVDRFGDLPTAVSHLLSVARLKVYGIMFSIESFVQKEKEIVLSIHASQSDQLDPQKLMTLGAGFHGKIRLGNGPTVQLLVKNQGMNPDESLQLLESFMGIYQDLLRSKGELHDVAK